MTIRRQMRMLLISAFLIGTFPATAQDVPSHIAQALPDHVVYRFLFKKTVALRQRANEWDSQGKDGRKLRSLIHRKAGLEGAESQTFDRIAEEHEHDIQALDAKARAIVQAHRALHPTGELPYGEEPQAPPAELKALQAEKNATTIRSIELLRASIRPESFDRLDNYAKKSIQLNPLSSTVPTGPLSLIPNSINTSGGQQ